jgi:hypothetical protein
MDAAGVWRHEASKIVGAVRYSRANAEEQVRSILKK